MNKLLSLFILIGLALPVSAAEPVKPITIEEWPVPFEKGRPRDPYVAPDGSVWFVGQTATSLDSIRKPKSSLSGILATAPVRTT